MGSQTFVKICAGLQVTFKPAKRIGWLLRFADIRPSIFSKKSFGSSALPPKFHYRKLLVKRDLYSGQSNLFAVTTRGWHRHVTGIVGGITLPYRCFQRQHPGQGPKSYETGTAVNLAVIR
jgi:hypothetical protein